MTSYTITKYQYYEYSLDDYNNIRHAFFEIYADHDATPAFVLIAGLGILKLLEEELGSVKDGESVLIGQDNHQFIIRFFKRQIQDLNEDIKQGFNPEWYFEMRKWIKDFSQVHEVLSKKIPHIEK